MSFLLVCVAFLAGMMLNDMDFGNEEWLLVYLYGEGSSIGNKDHCRSIGKLELPNITIALRP